MAHPPQVQAVVDANPALALIGNTPLVRIDLFDDRLPAGCEIWAKPEFMNPGGSIKDRPVLRMLAEAVARGDLRPGDPKSPAVLDSSSGNAGIAYAMIGAALGVPVELVIPANASEERKKRIKAHGAIIHFTDPIAGYDEALREVRRMYEARGGGPKRYFFSDQYGNDGNWRAHHDTTGVEILEQAGPDLIGFVAGVGTGGTITGVGRRLKGHDPSIHVGCIIPDSFPGVEGLKPLGDPEDIVPAILDQSLIDSRHDLTIYDAFEVCGALAKRGLFVGQSSGAYILGAVRVAQALGKPGKVVTVLNDIGERYFSTGLWD
jgi:cysteine synthase B